MKSLPPLFFALFLDFFGFALIISLIPFLFGASTLSLIPEKLPASLRYLLFGGYLGTYSLFQWIGNIFFSKWLSPKSAPYFIRFSYLGNALCYLIYAVGMYNVLLWPLFLGNAIAGFMGTHLSGTHTAIGSVSEEGSRFKFFVLSSLSVGLAFLTAPLFFAALLNPIESGQLSTTTIAIACSFLSLTASFFVGTPQMDSVSFQLQKRPQIRANKANYRLYISFVLFSVGFASFIKFFQLRIIETGQFSQKFICCVPSFFGLGVFISQLILLFIPFKKTKDELFFFVLIGAASMVMLSNIILNPLLLAILLVLISSAYALLQPSLPMVAIKSFQTEGHGASMALTQSAMAMGKSIAPLVCGLILYATGGGLSIVSGATLLLSAFALKGSAKRNIRSADAKQEEEIPLQDF